MHLANPTLANNLQDTAAITTIIHSVGSLADTGNFDSLEKLYAPEIELDYTSLTGGDIELKSPQALMAQWANILPGFDRTHHQVSNINVTLDNKVAEATAEVVAEHWVNSLYWKAQGSYVYKLRKEDTDWQITAHKLILRSEEGTREVFGPASQNANKNPSAYITRQKTRDVIHAFLKSLEAKDMATFAAVWADDAIQDMPYSPDGFPKKVSGKKNILEHYKDWPKNSENADFTSQLVFYPMQDPEMMFVEFKGDVDITPTKRKYKQHYGGLFHVENGKVKLFREYFDPAPFSYAFGL